MHNALNALIIKKHYAYIVFKTKGKIAERKAYSQLKP